MFCSSDHIKEVEYYQKIKELELLEERFNKKASDLEARNSMMTGLLHSKEISLENM